MEDSVADKKKPRCGPCMKWIGTPSFHLLCNFLLSQWGDWMWQFSVGLYLVHLSDGHLRLAATFGFTGGTCVLLFGGIIGDWVDRNGRLKVVRTSLFMQNISVALSASAVCLVLVLEPNVSDLGQGSPARYFMEGSIVVLAVIAQLASVAYKIAIEKDWIIVIAAGKSSVLANLNAITRSLDLLCKVVSPLTVGFIMSRFSMFASACLIAAWNVVSVFLEYGLLSSIYSQVPELAKKGIQETKDSEFGLLRDKSAANDIGDEGVEEERMRRIMEERTEAEKDNQCCVVRIFEPFLLLFTGWKTYARQSVVFAGISLACLYMTVLGFDSITLGYIYANHVSEFMVGVCMGLAGLTGIIGTLLFTIMAKRIGLERTGVFAFLAELTCLILALASVWAPGSKFDLHSAFSGSHKHLLLSTNEIISAHVTTPQFMWPNSSSSAIRNASSFQDFNNSMHLSHETSTSGEEMNIFPLQNISMILLLVGIIMSRIGLWMADLVVTQLMQESIAERERGIVNGIQNSLNMLMDMLKFALVIFLPQIEIFGLHIILSFSFISAGTAFFCFHVARTAKRRRKKPGIEDNNNKGPKDLFI